MARQFAAASSQYLRYAGAAVSADPFTLAGWFRVTDTTTNFVLGFVGNGGVDNSYYALRANAGSVTASKRNTTENTATATPGTYSANTWHHACGVWTNNTSRAAFLDGGNKGTNGTNTTDPTVTRTSLAVLDRLTQANFVDGLLAEWALWDVALTDAEVAILGKGYCPLCVRPQNLVSYWPLIGRNSPECDHVGGFELTLGNTPTTGAHPRIIYPSRYKFRPDLRTPAVAGGQPTMRRWGGVPGMRQRPFAGRSW